MLVHSFDSLSFMSSGNVPDLCSDRLSINQSVNLDLISYSRVDAYNVSSPVFFFSRVGSDGD
jgi:hypothetical protein